MPTRADNHTKVKRRKVVDSPPRIARKKRARKEAVMDLHCAAPQKMTMALTGMDPPVLIGMDPSDELM